jgi:hypothetical protein
MPPFPFGPATTFRELFRTLETQYQCRVFVICRPGDMHDTDGGPASGMVMVERDLPDGSTIQRMITYYDDDEYVMPTRHRSIFAMLQIDPLPPH